MVNAISAAQLNTAVQPSAPKPSALTSDFETFLKMLTAQARYQDPLEPIDSTEYAAQLAQFSMVEQQVQTNDSLASLIGSFGPSQFSSVSNWVGMEARAAMPAYYDGAPITISPNPAAASDKVELVVKNGSGAEIQRLALPVSAEPYLWNGLQTSGVQFPADTYSFHVESQKGGQVILAEPAQVYAPVQEAQIQNGEVILILPGGQAILASAVTALRDPI